MMLMYKELEPSIAMKQSKLGMKWKCEPIKAEMSIQMTCLEQIAYNWMALHLMTISNKIMINDGTL